jgi:hypothetical protein
MNDLTGLGFWVGFWLCAGLVSSVAVIASLWARTRERQMRNEVVLKLLETGQSLDPGTLDKLFASPARAGAAGNPAGDTDPRAGYRAGNTIFFLLGFGTLLFAFLRDAGPSYPVIALGVFAIVMAFLGWRIGDRQFRDGTLPTLKYKRDPRDPYLHAGSMFFFIGYGTMLIGIVRDAGISYPIIGLGLFLVVMCILMWRRGDREYREGRLTGVPRERERA